MASSSTRTSRKPKPKAKRWYTIDCRARTTCVIRVKAFSLKDAVERAGTVDEDDDAGTDPGDQIWQQLHETKPGDFDIDYLNSTVALDQNQEDD